VIKCANFRGYTDRSQAYVRYLGGHGLCIRCCIYGDFKAKEKLAWLAPSYYVAWSVIWGASEDSKSVEQEILQC